MVRAFTNKDKIHHQFYHKLSIIGIALGYQQLVRITYMLIFRIYSDSRFFRQVHFLLEPPG